MGMASALGEGPVWFWKYRNTSLASGAFRVKVTVWSELTDAEFNVVANWLLGRTLAVAIPEGPSVTRTSVTTMSSDNITMIFFLEINM
jgi:hypothetical protein